MSKCKMMMMVMVMMTIIKNRNITLIPPTPISILEDTWFFSYICHHCKLFSVSLTTML